ncbi:MAG: hypothetical protein HC859_17185, partial [Bacteroidia bacterium]|nr:hypothetical protein [Bacteroidia bacterium]
ARPFLGGQQIAIIPGQSGQYDVRLISTATGCSYNATLNAVVVGSFTLSLDATFACEGDPFTITATTNQPATTFTWTFDGTAVPGQSNATLVDTRAGNYAATASITTSGQTCMASNDIDVVVGERTPGNLNNNAIICNDPANTDPNTNQVVLDPGASFQSYNWFKDQVPLGITTPTLTATEQGLYSVELTNSIGCVSTDETQVSIECLPKITGPNAFRPNGANPNFFLYSFFIDDADFQVFIFNRWGEMVYQSDERLFKWNGGYNNSLAQPAPPGTYSYVVKYKSSYRPEDGVQEKRGGVVLLR